MIDYKCELIYLYRCLKLNYDGTNNVDNEILLFYKPK